MEYVQIDKQTGRLFKKERDKRGLTLEEMEDLTEKIGRRISKSTISSLETNNINYTTKEKIRVILRALDSNKLRDYEFSIIPKRGSSQTSRTVNGKELLEKERTKKEEKLEELEKLIFKLRSKGNSYEDIGSFSNVSSNTIYRIAEGETTPTKETIEKILSALRESVQTKTEEGSESSQYLGLQALDAQEGDIRQDLAKMVGAIIDIMNSPELPNQYKIVFFSSLYNLIMTYSNLITQLSSNEDTNDREPD